MVDSNKFDNKKTRMEKNRNDFRDAVFFTYQYSIFDQAYHSYH